MGEPTVRLDTSVPALLVKVGRYPVHAGGLGVIRSLGQLGVPVYAITEDRWTPAAVSRHLAGHVVWRDSDREQPDRLVRRLCEIGRWLGRPAVPVATDDEAAALLAEHADELREHFLLPPVEPGLPARLASKRGLYDLCLEHDIPAPRTVFPTDGAHLLEVARDLTFPIVAKNVDPWVRLSAPVVDGTTIVIDRDELMDRFGRSSDLSGLLLQEHIPHDSSEDWFVHSYCDGESATVATFAGRKAYAWPPGRGVTADARAAVNPVLTELTGRFCKAVGYRGVNDLDWRYDVRDGRYKLLDFNPRVGAQFAFGRTEGGVDVVRALHLDMTGRAVPAGNQDYARRMVVENVYLPARLGHRLARLPAAPAPAPGTRTRGAWCSGAVTDPLPVLAMALRYLRPASAGLGRVLVQGVRRAAGRMPTTNRPLGGRNRRLDHG
jgi:predicted ATP-grasp superfamily ATP-dependent carboligase